MAELPCPSCGKSVPASDPPARCPECAAGANPRPDSLAPGTAFGKYTLTAEIGRGSMGVVYDAQDTLLHRRVALKIMHPRRSEPKDAVNDWQRFMQEARLTANVAKHPNVITVYEAAVHDSRRFIAMEYVAGEPMGRWRRGRATREQIRLLRDVAQAVHHAHEHGIIHRDLKPGNVLVGKGGVPVVTDFGLATYERKGTSLSLTPSGFVVGSPAYMSPEQARGQKDVDRTTDVYAIGIMIYEAIADRPPFDGKNPVETLSRVVEGTRVPPSQARPLPEGDPALDQLCMKAMARDARDRFATCADLARALTGWLDRSRPAPPKRLFTIQVAVFAALCSLLAAILVWNKIRNDQRELEFREQMAATLKTIEELRTRPPPPPLPDTAATLLVPIDSFRMIGEHAPNRAAPDRLRFFKNGLFEAPLTVPERGEYQITVRAACDPAKNQFARFELTIDGRMEAELELTSAAEESYHRTVPLDSGAHRLGIRFTNDYYDAESKEDRNLRIHEVVLRKRK